MKVRTDEDEATSALHVAGQADVMEAIARHLPGVIIVSVGHRPELEAFHDRKLMLVRGEAGATIVGDARIRRTGRGGPTLVPVLQEPVAVPAE